MQAKGILHFWFDQLTDKQPFAKDAALQDRVSSAEALVFSSAPASSF